MNLIHRWYCRSEGWGKVVKNYMIPHVLEDVSLGDDVLEIGPGPGLTTNVLREIAPRLTCIEIDHALAEKLKVRMAGTNVTVVEGDGTKMPFPDGSFSGAVSLTMLHHVPSAELQDRLLAETCRVLKPGGVFAGSDSRPSLRWNLFHILDTRVPVNPETLPDRLERAGFTDVAVTQNPYAFRFRARKP